MSTIDSQTAADREALAKALAERRPVDPEVRKRIHERAEAARQELARRGFRDIAVDLIREGREE